MAVLFLGIHLSTGDERKRKVMKLKKILGLSVVTVLLCLTGCTNKNAMSEYEAVTILAPYLECDRLAALVHEKYPEVNLEIFSYSGANTTQYLQNMLAADDLPDICTQTVYDPNVNDMPVMNGYEATKAIRRSSHELAQKIPIIAMTANAFSEDIQHSLAAGMNAHVSKPVEMKVLEKTIRSIKSGGGGYRTAGH